MATLLISFTASRVHAFRRLIGSAKLNGIDPQRYLTHVLQRIADHPMNRIDELLPWAVAKTLVDKVEATELPIAA